MTATPTPGDLSARLLACPFCGGAAERIDFGPGSGDNEGGSCIACTKCQASGPVEFGYKENFVANWNRRAALSALPAAGGAVAWRNHDAAIDAKALATAQEIALMWGQDRSQFVSRIQVAVIDAMRWFDAATTPQPSAADDYESWAKQERQREDTATRLGSAAVGAQGDAVAYMSEDGTRVETREFVDWYRLHYGANSAPVTDLPTPLYAHAAPAAGKGVDDVLADMRRTTPGDDEHIEALLADYADKIEAALTRQPVAGDGMVLVPVKLTPEMESAGLFGIGRDDVPGELSQRAKLHGAWAAMLAAAPAATPTDGGEGR